MKKFTMIILALVLVFSMSTTSFAAVNGGATQVSVTVDSTQISVTVPTALAISALVDGGSATIPENYSITNGSAIPIKVDTIAVTLNDAEKWAFKDSEIAAGTAQATGKNDIYLRVNGQVMEVQSAIAPTTPASWNIAASSTLNLPVVCSTSRLNQMEDESNLITITYVISAGSHS